jgi:zinc transporter ZupT
MNRVLLASIALLSIVIAAVHLTALNTALYWIHPWLDECMHLIGGALLALIGLWLALRFGYISRAELTNWRTMIYLFVFVLTISAGWEIFEVWAGIPIYESYARDTVSDFVMDLLGGALLYSTVCFMNESQRWHVSGVVDGESHRS